MDKLERSVTNKGIDSVIRKDSTKKSTGLDGFSVKFYQTF